METKPRVTRLAPVLNERLNEDHNLDGGLKTEEFNNPVLN
jgi:hypothetical protein